MHRRHRAVKRVFDVVASAVGLVITAPIMGAAAVAIRATMGPPVLFRQTRPGQDGKLFTLLKFRTMRPVDAVSGETDDGHRMTRLGAFLRSTSIDELPELWNVLRGDMSIVGPRPLLTEYLHLYTPEQARRHEVRPGLTGLAQVSGRNRLSWEERFKLDVEYVDTWSTKRDLAIIWATVWAVLRREGISAEGAATMERFCGSEGAGPRHHSAIDD